jgi:hypothetical protein
LVARFLCNLGTTADGQGDIELAIARKSEALEIGRRLNDRVIMSCDLASLGYLYQLTGEMEKARTHLAEVLRLAAPKSEFKAFSATALEHAGRLAAVEADRFSRVDRQGTMAHAARLFAGAQMIRASLGHLLTDSTAGHLPTDSAVQERVSALRETMGRAAFEEAWSEGLAMSYDEVIAYALEYLENARDEQGSVSLCDRY